MKNRPSTSTNSFFQNFCTEFHAESDNCKGFSSANLLPSLGARINQDTKPRKHIISPFSPFYRAWEMLLIALVIYSAWTCPFQFSFMPFEHGSLFIIGNTVNFFFAADIVLTFFVAYLDTESYLLVDDPKKIATRYIFTWFIFDFCSTMPLQTLSLLFTHPSNSTGFEALDMLRLWRLRRVSSLIGNMTNLAVNWTSRTRKFRDTVQLCSEFATRNQLPRRIQDQMLSHIHLRFKTEGLRQQVALNELPKAIRFSIAHYLFFPVIRDAQLFLGVSHDFICQLVPEVDPEYFPPREDVILQNEMQTDLYILVTGEVHLIAHTNSHNMIYGRAGAGESFGEIGIFSDSPQPYTVCTTTLSQILRLSKKKLANIMKENIQDSQIIRENLLKKLEDLRRLGIIDPEASPCFRFNMWKKGLKKEGYVHDGNQENDGLPIKGGRGSNCLQQDVINATETDENMGADTKMDLHSKTGEAQTNLHDATRRPHIDSPRLSLEERAAEFAKKTSAEQNSLTDRSTNCKDARKSEQLEFASTDIEGLKTTNIQTSEMHALQKQNSQYENVISSSNRLTSANYGNHFPTMPTQKRISIFAELQSKYTEEKITGKLILLPDSMEGLFKIAGHKFGGLQFTKVVNEESAEIDDIKVIRDGDRLFFIVDSDQ